jgi:hypothetical protein
MKKVYVIMGKYCREPKEEIDTAENKQDAEYLLGEYRMAFGAGWTLTIKTSNEVNYETA